MRVGLDATPLANPRTGVGQVAVAHEKLESESLLFAQTKTRFEKDRAADDSARGGEGARIVSGRLVIEPLHEAAVLGEKTRCHR